jgi:hypothetical protein
LNSRGSTHSATTSKRKSSTSTTRPLRDETSALSSFPQSPTLATALSSTRDVPAGEHLESSKEALEEAAESEDEMEMENTYVDLCGQDDIFADEQDIFDEIGREEEELLAEGELLKGSVPVVQDSSQPVGQAHSAAVVDIEEVCFRLHAVTIFSFTDVQLSSFEARVTPFCSQSSMRRRFR